MKIIERLYILSIYLYGLALRIAAFFHPKASKWVGGRKDWEIALRNQITGDHAWIWFHCASLGEFEQGRNLIEQLKQAYPEHRILLSFFSPSGYEIRKNYAHADFVCYLPLDTPQNARIFLSILQPSLVVFIKYELWLSYLHEIRNRAIPFILVAARVRANSPFFTSIFKSLYQKAFREMTHIFTQDQTSLELIQSFSGNPNISVSSDTRYDRVSSNKAEFTEIPEITSFKSDRVCLVAGSTWPKGEGLLLDAYRSLRTTHNLCLILAPHEIYPDRIDKWEAEFPAETIRFSQIDQLNESHTILWIDNIGMLSRLYHYADIAYIGGAWGTGLHNILEAAVFGSPVIIGPKHQKFPEAAELIEAGGAFSINTPTELIEVLTSLLQEPQLRKEIERINEAFIAERAGATEKVLRWCKASKSLD